MKKNLNNIIGKICCKCKIEKNISEFGNLSSSKDGLNYSCKDCHNKRSKEYSKKNHNKVLKSQGNWRRKHPELVYKSHKKYRLSNREKVNQRLKNFYKNNPEKRKEYRENYRPRKREQRKERRASDEVFKITNNIRARLYRYMKKLNITKRNRTFDIVGITPSELKNHIEKQFVDGMNWGNYGQFGWHIDHRIPLDSAKTEDELYKLCHYTNLQPLWWLDNIHKSAKIV